VVREVDVVVAGAGVGGTLAALTAAQEGMTVLVIDRFGVLGGNLGAAGLIIGGRPGLRPTGDELYRDSPAMYDRFVSRAEALLRDQGLAIDTAADHQKIFPQIAHAYSRVAVAMAEELGGRPHASAYASAPVLEGSTVRGLFVETKSGRVAVMAKVTVECDRRREYCRPRRRADALRGAPGRNAEPQHALVDGKPPLYPLQRGRHLLPPVRR